MNPFLKTLKKHPLITGTFILTVTGFISRIIGFFYRIYLSRLFGEEGMGIYQLLSPVLALSFSLCASGYQTAVSKLVAEYTAKKNTSPFRPMLAGLSISMPLSFLCCGVIFTLAEPIGVRLLQEPRTVSMLRILAFSIPFSSIHACINGYFYGVKKAGIPAASQLVEQLIRVSCVYLVSVLAYHQGKLPNINVAVLGLSVGEFFSMMVTLVAIYLCALKRNQIKKAPLLPASAAIYTGLLQTALPLTANRLVLNFLQSIEAVSIPARLKLYGYDTKTALSVYGVLTGMAMPLIFFPNAVTGSIAVLLLPTISENYALGNLEAVKKVALRTIKYCFLMGFACMLIFGSCGRFAGQFLFHSALAGHFITTLSFICPFLYLDTTLSSILQGLGMAGNIFAVNVVCLLLRLGFVFYCVPLFGITGYLWGMLASQILLSLLYLLFLFLFLRKKK